MFYSVEFFTPIENNNHVLIFLHCCMHWLLWHLLRFLNSVQRVTVLMVLAMVFQAQPLLSDCSYMSEEDFIEESGNSVQLPITSYPCQWKPLRIRKESNMKLSEADFEKHIRDYWVRSL